VDYSDSLRLGAESALDALAVEQLVSTHRPRVYRLALSILDDAAEADEAAQDALLTALNALDSYRGEAAFSTWLYTITLNVCRARLRKRQTAERLLRTLKTVFWPLGDRSRLPEDDAILNETGADVWRAVNELDEKHRLPVILRYYHDFSTDEIAQMLKINEGTVRSRLHTAREQLRGRLNGRLAGK
jgi:RNA polymerase sigma-70 factor (ECF subfamily)